MAPSCSSSSEHMALPYSATIVIYSCKMTITLPPVPLVDLNMTFVYSDTIINYSCKITHHYVHHNILLLLIQIQL